MAYNFHPVNRGQEFILPVNMADWLPRDHFVYFVIDLVGQLDLSEFLAAHRADGKGGAAYHPAVMVALFVYAYCDGERSSRRIEEHCRTDIAYSIITGGKIPDHSTVARFRERPFSPAGTAPASRRPHERPPGGSTGPPTAFTDRRIIEVGRRIGRPRRARRRR